MKLAILLQEVHSNAGQTYDIIELIKAISSLHKTWSFDIITHRIFYPLNSIFQAPNVKLIEIRNLYSNLIFPNDLSKLLSQYDVILVKGSYPFVISADRSGKPNILIVHQLDSPKLFRSLRRKIRSYIIIGLTGYILRKPTAIATITEELAFFYSKKYKIKVYIVHDIISESFYQLNLRLTPRDLNTLKLLCIGNWDGFNNRKRHELVIKYFSYAVSKYPHMKLTMAGLSAGNKDVLLDVAKSYKVENNVILKGFLSEEELGHEYLLNDIYVTATTYEGFYRQIIEGFASGMPALVYDARLVVDDIAHCASVNHVIKSLGGKLYREPKEFVCGIEDIVENYTEYSINGAKYSEKYKARSLSNEIDNLISSVTSNTKDERNENEQE